jgi:uncharacterized OB-fold protein
MTEVMTSRPLREGLFDTQPPRLLASECSDCGAFHFPPRRGCPDCHGVNVRPRSLSTKGDIRTFTIVRNAPSLFEQPYAIAFVALPEGVQVFAQIVDTPFTDIRIGLPVELVIRVIRHDEARQTDIVAYSFRGESRQ